MKVAILDDEPDILEVMRLMLEIIGIRAAAAPCPSRLPSPVGSYDLVITDFRFRGTDRTGEDVAREFRRENPAGVVIVMTGYDRVETSAHRCVKKPIEMKDLAKVVRWAEGELIRRRLDSR